MDSKLYFHRIQFKAEKLHEFTRELEHEIGWRRDMLEDNTYSDTVKEEYRTEIICLEQIQAFLETFQF